MGANKDVSLDELIQFVTRRGRGKEACRIYFWVLIVSGFCAITVLVPNDVKAELLQQIRAKLAPER